MFRHLTIAALRNLSANRLQSAIAIFGLSIGIAAAILMALVLRNQASFEHFIPGYERTYLVATEFGFKTPFADFNSSVPQYADLDGHLVALARLNIPEVDTAYLESAAAVFHRGQIDGEEKIYWADPDIFAVLPLPFLYGDLTNSLDRPDGLVLPVTAARKYFGRDNVVGEAIDLDGQPMTVMAVIQDLPANATNLQSGIFASGLSANSPQAKIRAEKPLGPNKEVINFRSNAPTFMRLKPGTSFEDAEKKFAALPGKHWSAKFAKTISLHLIPIDQVNLLPNLNPVLRSRMEVGLFVGLLILFIACVNFVNLLTARAARRSVEVGVRKVCGAARKVLVLQFLGETLVTVTVAAIIAMAFSEWLLPAMNAYLGTAAMFDYWREPVLLLWLALGIILLSLLSGAYPAFVLSAFSPALALKGWASKFHGGALIRNLLVTLQFSILIGLSIAAILVYQQRLYAVSEALRVNTDQMLIVTTNSAMPCPVAFKTEVRKLPGVRGAACTGKEFTEDFRRWGDGYDYKYHGKEVGDETVWVEPGVYRLYGVKPLAGTLPLSSPSGDPIAGGENRVVLNQTLSRHMGFASSQDAIGQRFDGSSREIVAVIPDFSLVTVEQPLLGMIYESGMSGAPSTIVNIKLNGHQIPETLDAIERLWRATNPNVAFDRYFLDQHIQERYRAMLREAQLFALGAGVAIFLACLGLLGLSISVAERRVKEIGVRKAMGATSADIARLLLWQFAKPVLWANLIAWPIAFYEMNNWLNGFARHVTLGPLPFFGAMMLAILVALLTVMVQAVRTARAVPATALRYE